MVTQTLICYEHMPVSKGQWTVIPTCWTHKVQCVLKGEEKQDLHMPVSKGQLNSWQISLLHTEFKFRNKYWKWDALNILINTEECFWLTHFLRHLYRLTSLRIYETCQQSRCWSCPHATRVATACTRVTPNNMREWRPRRSNKTRTSTTGRNYGSTFHFLYQKHLKSKTIRSGLSKAKNIWHSHDDRFDLFTKQHRQRFMVLEVTMHFNATVYIRKLRHIHSGSNCSFIHSSLIDVIKY